MNSSLIHVYSEEHVGKMLVSNERTADIFTLQDKSGPVVINMTHPPYYQDGTYHTAYNVSYFNALDFETNFDSYFYVNLVGQTRWMAKWFMVLYLGGIYLLKKYMKTREKFDLRAPLFLWNFCLATLSLFGAIRTISELLQLINNYGLTFSFCFAGKPFLDNRVGGFWNWMFTLSKVPELGDTVFIVLRKQPLIFLHWYHHVTVLLYTWYSYSDYIATARWFVCMNYLVHSIMYSYYALKALRFRVPRFVAMFITTAQLAQMVMGSAVNIWAYQVKQAGNECHVSYENIKISLIMYTSYFVLFAHFFRRAYMKKPTLGDQQKLKNIDAPSFEYKKGKLE